MSDDARHLAQAEIESLQDFLGDKRVAQQRYQEEADREAVKIKELEAELAQRQQEHNLT